MPDWLTPYLIVCPLVFLSGVVDAIGGGGGLISIPAYLLAGLPPHAALGCNKFSSSVGMVVSTSIFVRKGFVPLGALFYALLALGGSSIGTSLTLLIDERIFRILLLFVLPFTAIVIFRSKALLQKENKKVEQITGRMHLIASLSALIIGMYDGFYGPGTGTFLLLILTGVAGFDLLTASGTTKVINFASNIAAVVIFLINGKVLFPLAAIAAIFSIGGQYLGSRLIQHNGAKIVRPVVLLVLLLLALKLVGELGIFHF